MKKLNRREFLKLCGIALAGVAASKIPEVEKPTELKYVDIGDHTEMALFAPEPADTITSDMLEKLWANHKPRQTYTWIMHPEAEYALHTIARKQGVAITTEYAQQTLFGMPVIVNQFVPRNEVWAINRQESYHVKI